MIKRRIGYLVVPMLFSSSCGNISLTQPSEDESTTETVNIDESAPSDSTNSTGSVTLAIASTQADSAALALADESTLSISENIVLSYAKFSIAKIKIKTKKDQDDNEKLLEKQESDIEDTKVDDLDKKLEENTASLLRNRASGNDGEAESENAENRHKQRVARIKSDIKDLKSEELERLEQEVLADDTTKFKGPYVYDAVLGKIEGDAPKVDLIDGSYKRIEFQLKRNFKVETTEPLFSNVFVIKGTVKKDNVDVPFEIDWHRSLNFRLVADTPFKVEAGQENELLIQFDPYKWFEGVDFSNAKVDDNGTIYINKIGNRDIMRKIHRNIKKASGFGKDKDRDGRLQQEEKSGDGQVSSDPAA